MTIIEKLQTIQSKLKAPKNQMNKFGGYKYRSCEDILEAVKPLLAETKTALTLEDTMQEVGGRVYVKATATLYDTETDKYIVTTANAREEETKKGMDGSQITGAASSYARKYALNGLFAIDDAKDGDATNTDEDNKPKAPKPASKPIVADRELLVEKLTEQGKLESTLKWAKENYKCDNIADLPDNVVVSLLKRCGVE